MDPDIEESEYSIPTDRLYAVVEIVTDEEGKDGESDVVTYSCPASSNWLYNVKRIIDDGKVRYYGLCKWPRNETKLSSLLEKRTKPGPDWQEYPNTRVLKFCRSIGQAKELATKAVNNDSLTESDTGSVVKRRRIKPPRFGILDSSDSEDDNPPLRRLKLNSAPANQNSGVPSRQSLVWDRNEKALLTQTQGSCSANKSLVVVDNSDRGETSAGGSNCSKEIAKPDNSEGLKERETERVIAPLITDHIVNNEVHGSKSNEASFVSSTPTNTGLSVEQSPINTSTPMKVTSKITQRPVCCTKTLFSPRKVASGSSSVSHYVFMREMQDIRRMLNGLRVTANKIYNTVCPVIEVTDDNDEGRGLPALPVDSFEGMKSWENFLGDHDHDNSLHVVRLLSDRCCVTGLKDSVYAMMKFIMSNKLACAFNYKGKNKKEAKIKKLSFYGTRSCTVVNASLKNYEESLKKSNIKLAYTTGPEEVGLAMGLWLKDATKRYLIELRGSKRLPDTATKVPDEMMLIPEEENDPE